MRLDAPKQSTPSRTSCVRLFERIFGYHYTNMVSINILAWPHHAHCFLQNITTSSTFTQRFHYDFGFKPRREEGGEDQRTGMFERLLRA